MKPVKAVFEGSDIPACLSARGGKKICVVPEGTEVIGRRAFIVNLYTPDEQRDIREIILPESLKTIEEEAFLGRKSLEKIIIPIGVEEIKAGAFERCVNLSVYCRAAEKPPGWVEEYRHECFLEDYALYCEHYWISWLNGHYIAYIEDEDGILTAGSRDRQPSTPGAYQCPAGVVWGYAELCGL